MNYRSQAPMGQTRRVWVALENERASDDIRLSPEDWLAESIFSEKEMAQQDLRPPSASVYPTRRHPGAPYPGSFGPLWRTRTYPKELSHPQPCSLFRAGQGLGIPGGNNCSRLTRWTSTLGPRKGATPAIPTKEETSLGICGVQPEVWGGSIVGAGG